MKNDIALLLLRMSGVGLALAHGWGKLERLVSGDSARLIEGVARLGFPMPTLFSWAAALSEFGGGLLVALGLFTRFGAAAAAFTMVVAAFLRHRAHEHLAVVLGLREASEETLKAWGSPELALAYLAAFLVLLLTGPGRFALDRFVAIKGGKKH